MSRERVLEHLFRTLARTQEVPVPWSLAHDYLSSLLYMIGAPSTMNFLAGTGAAFLLLRRMRDGVSLSC